jgi:error-prone DNA polymerase
MAYHYVSIRLPSCATSLTFLNISPCDAVRTAKDGARITVVGIVELRQRPGSAKGAMSIKLEDETGEVKLVVWPSLFDKQRQIILGAGMIACRGVVQSQKGVIHLIAEHLIDQSDMLRKIGGLDEAFVLPTGRGDEAVHGGGAGADSRDKMR